MFFEGVVAQLLVYNLNKVLICDEDDSLIDLKV
jgi:hypothetical protein